MYLLVLFIISLFSSLVTICNSQRRIQDGAEVTQNKPYVVYFVRAEDESPVIYDEWICGGAIVSQFYVVTSAACVEDTKYLHVVAGYDKYVKDEDINTDKCTRDMKKKVIYTCLPQTYHFNYHLTESWAFIDIALAKVDDPFNFHDKSYETKCSYIPKPIKINYENEYQQPGRDAMVLGWGHTKIWREPGNTQLLNTPKLNYAPVLLAEKEMCKPPYLVISNMSIIIDLFMLCTMNKGNIDAAGEPILTSSPIAKGCTALGLMDVLAHTVDCPVQSDGMVVPDSRRKLNLTNNRTRRYDSKYRRYGICQNDHGGPLVTWVGSHEILIGVASVFMVGDKQQCQGPYLYTSTQCNGAFLSCMLTHHNNKGFRRFEYCGISPSERTYHVKENHISWKNYTQRTKENKTDNPLENDNLDISKNETVSTSSATDKITLIQLENASTAIPDNTTPVIKVEMHTDFNVTTNIDNVKVNNTKFEMYIPGDNISESNSIQMKNNSK